MTQPEAKVERLAEQIALAGAWPARGEKPDFRTYIKHHVVIGDGAMATFLHQSGVPVRTCYEELCLSNPQLVEDVHRAYITAGATLLQTNTFSANRAGLGRYGLENLVQELNQRAAQIALRAAQGKAFVFGTIGSIDGLLPYRERAAVLEEMSLPEQFEEQAQALLLEPIDGLLLESFADLEEMLVALDAVRGLTDLPIIANLSPVTVGVTRDGVAVDEAFRQMRVHGADVVGLNCRLGPSGILRTYEAVQIRPEDGYAAVPNAGLLHIVEGDYSYTGSSDYFAEVATDLVHQGVHLIGGCCGTTPEHVRKVALRLAEVENRDGPDGAIHQPTSAQAPATDPATRGMATPMASAAIEAETKRPPMPPTRMTVEQAPLQPTSSLLDRVARQTTVIVELDPPRTLDVAKYLQGARALRDAGVDFVTLADNSLGHVRVSNMALASLLKQENIEPLVHVTCRDRNLIGQQSHLMGLNVLDIHHILLVTGDPSKFGDLPGATSVYDTSSIELTKMVKRLNGGIAFSGQPLAQPSQFVVGTSFNPHVLHFGKAVDRLRRKIAAGADYVMTQPMFDTNMFKEIHDATKDFGVPIFAGIMPLVSERNAQFLHNEVPGIQLPAAVLERMSGTSKEQGLQEGLAIAEELIDAAMQYFKGIYLITPF
ncbi:MAG: bifunctional homocysteine S-methyltransferase/methylenetetrahydrofolate reductase, partial [Alicyclobacillus sp. RIFOXYA1_FULL_53_8]